jgi:hypothetical protein
LQVAPHLYSCLSGPRSRPTTSQKIWWRQESNPGPLDLWPETLTTRPQRRSVSFQILLLFPLPLDRSKIIPVLHALSTTSWKMRYSSTIANLDTRWDGLQWLASRPCRLILEETSPEILCTEDWVGLGGCLDFKKISCPCRKSNPDLWVIRFIAYRLRYPCYLYLIWPCCYLLKLSTQVII